MQLRVFFNPAELIYVEADANDIYIVLDIMRATTTMTVMFDRGARHILAAQTLEQAQEAALMLPGHLLCGERQTKTPPGFDYGNSPAQFAQFDLNGRELILTTSNGTRALFACPAQSTRLAGCFYNGLAVIGAAFQLAEQRNSNISIVCAAEYGYFALEDSACAGYLAYELLQRHPELEVHDSVLAAITLHENYDTARLTEYARSSKDLIAGGLQQDLAFCLRKNGSSKVASVVGEEPVTGLLLIEQL